MSTTIKSNTIEGLHGDHKDWLSKLDFYEHEIAKINNRLAEVASKNTGKDTLAIVEHIQNQMIVQKQNIDTLTHNINEHETYLMKKVESGPTASDQMKSNDHPKLRAEIESFEKHFNELRKELLTFLSKVL